jgi:2'-5' RNA ligase
MIFPHFKNLDLIDEIRKKYDPLAELVPPHITLVFPFKSTIRSEKLIEWMRISLNNIKPFYIKMGGLYKEMNAYGNYLFLNVLIWKR